MTEGLRRCLFRYARDDDEGDVPAFAAWLETDVFEHWLLFELERLRCGLSGLEAVGDLAGGV